MRPPAEGRTSKKDEARVFYYVHHSYFSHLLTKDVVKIGISDISRSSVAPIAVYDI